MSICISDDPTIERNIRSTFLCPQCDAEGYKLRMLESNDIPGLLKLTVIESNGERKLCYDISSRESLREAMAGRVLSEEHIANFIKGLNSILSGMDMYLLDAGDIVLKSEYIYVSEKLEPALCCVPDYCGNYAAALSDILRGILGAVDQNDHRAVVLAYRLYQKTLEPNYTINDLMNILKSDEPHDARRIPAPEQPVAQSPAMFQNETGYRENDINNRQGSVPDNDAVYEMMAAAGMKSRKKKKGFSMFRQSK